MELQPNNFELQTDTCWSFPNRGNWATHNAKYRGNWSPYIPRNILLRYSKEGDRVLDQFAGGGTTLVEAKLLNRHAIGVDINQTAVNLCKKAIAFDCNSQSKIEIKLGDAQNLSFIKDNSIDLIATHPPYADIIHYSEDIDNDLSLLKVDDFVVAMEKVASESYRVLKKEKFCAVLIGDTRKNGCIIPLGFRTMEVFKKAGFSLKEIIIKHQHNCQMTGFWKKRSVQYNFLLIAHEYVFVFKKK